MVNFTSFAQASCNHTNIPDFHVAWDLLCAYLFEDTSETPFVLARGNTGCVRIIRQGTVVYCFHYSVWYLLCCNKPTVW